MPWNMETDGIPDKHVDVTITKTSEYLSISIEDEGSGFQHKSVTGKRRKCRFKPQRKRN